MKIKTNKINAVLCLSVIFIFCLYYACFGKGKAETAETANAATTPKYSLAFDYTLYYNANTTKKIEDSGTNTYSATIKGDKGNATTVQFYIYGSSVSGTGNLPKGGTIASNSLTITLETTISEYTMTVTNSSGTSVGYQSGKNYTLSSLSDGTYNFTCALKGTGWNPNSRTFAWYNTDITSSFKVDATPPKISGASTSSTGKYTNAAFTVSASDTGGSGVKALYYKAPGSSSYSSVASSKTFAAGSTNGVYSCYAEDNAGNQSATYYVYYDNVKPTGVIKNASGTTLISASTNGAFSYTASDSGCGVSYLQYMTPSSSSWTSYTSGTTIAATATNGTYQFRAVDKAGNISDVKTIILDTTKPVGVLYSGTTAVSSGAKSTASYIKYVASDAVSGIKTVYVKKPDESEYSNYTNGAQMTINGTYYFYCVDGAGNACEPVSISLDNIKPTLSISNGNFGDTLSDSFSVTATDNIGGTTLYFKAPSSSSFVQVSGTTMSVSKIMPDGAYQFYAVDGYGNTSDTYSVTLSIPAPVAQIVKASDGTKRCIIWTDSACSGTLDGESYVNGTWIGAEGNHTFVLTNDAQRSSTYIFTIDHYYRISGVVDSTCTADGYTVYVCDNCGDSYHANVTSAHGHDYDTTVTAPTCTERGYTTKTCSDCGESVIENYTDALGHTYGAWTISKNATCTESGLRYKTCSACNDRYSEVIPALGHDYETEVIEPTCVDKGYTTHICSRCGEGYNDSFVAALGHDYQPIRVEPTCAEDGYAGQCCSRCGDTYKTEVLKATGHDYVESYVAVTCTEEGCILHICLNCGFEYKTDVVSPSGHSLETHVLLAATCEEKGERYYGCTKCDYERIDEIPAKGHNYELAHEENVDGIIRRTYICSTCADSYTQEVGAEYEEVSNYVEYLFNEYSPYMIRVFLGTSGVWSIAMGIALIIAHKNEDKAKAKKMLVNYGIGLIVIFILLVAAPLLVKGIAGLLT